MLVHPLQSLLNIHIAIQINIAVNRMIIMAVKIQILLISKIRNVGRISSRFIAVGIVREQSVHHETLQLSVRRGKCSLHLIIDNSIDRQRRILRFQLIMPALLFEDFLMLINIRIKDRIHINMHEILKVLVIAACHRIQCLVRIGGGIEIGV